MVVESKLDDAVDGFTADRKILNRTRLCTTCEKFGGLHLAEPSLTAGWQADRLAKFGQGLKY